MALWREMYEYRILYSFSANDRPVGDPLPAEDTSRHWPHPMTRIRLPLSRTSPCPFRIQSRDLTTDHRCTAVPQISLSSFLESDPITVCLPGRQTAPSQRWMDAIAETIARLREVYYVQHMLNSGNKVRAYRNSSPPPETRRNFPPPAGIVSHLVSHQSETIRITPKRPVILHPPVSYRLKPTASPRDPQPSAPWPCYGAGS
jgi:hypothetical protein